VTVRVGAQKLAAVRRSGLAATVGCDEACALRLQLRLAAATARKLKLPVVVGTASRSLAAAGTTKASVKLKAGRSASSRASGACG
jgi:hypothetical protein